MFLALFFSLSLFNCVPAGLAFGTGDHPTTRLCLRWLRRLSLGGSSIMDYGTGSGVLAIAALLMGAQRAVSTWGTWDVRWGEVVGGSGSEGARVGQCDGLWRGLWFGQ